VSANKRSGALVVSMVAGGVALGAALVPLLLLDGPKRTSGYRAFALVLGVVALRAVVRFHESSAAPPQTTPFGRPRRLPRLALPRRHRAEHRTEHEAMVRAASDRVGQFHTRLRPLLQAAADERLQARHATTLATGGEGVLDDASWRLLRPDLPAPRDRRAPGPTADELDHLTRAVEAL